MSMQDEYKALMKQQLAEWKTQADGFKARAAQLEAQAKARFDEHLELLRAKQAAAWKHFDALKGANESTWTEFKSHLDKAGGEVRAAVDELKKMFRP